MHTHTETQACTHTHSHASTHGVMDAETLRGRLAVPLRAAAKGIPCKSQPPTHSEGCDNSTGGGGRPTTSKIHKKPFRKFRLNAERNPPQKEM